LFFSYLFTCQIKTKLLEYVKVNLLMIVLFCILDASDLMGIIDTHYAMVESYKSRLATLDAELLRLLKMFIRHLLDFGWAGNAGHRLESHLESQSFLYQRCILHQVRWRSFLPLKARMVYPYR